MRLTYILAYTLVMISCNGSAVKPTQQEGPKKPEFTMITIPGILTGAAERASYFATHYWDNLDFKDTAFISYPDIMEQAFVNYIDVLPHISPEVGIASLKKMMDKASVEKKMHTCFYELSEKYLYDPTSPMRNEEFFIPVLESRINFSELDEAEKVRPRKLYQLALKNRVGMRASDFSFTLANGQRQTVYQYKSEYLLLLFYDPGCHACKEVMDRIKASTVMNTYMAENRLKIVAVYPDEELDEWKKYLNEVPSTWVNGYDQDIYVKNEEIYNLKAIPTAYLLDKNKNVVLKDASFEQIEAIFSSNE